MSAEPKPYNQLYINAWTTLSVIVTVVLFLIGTGLSKETVKRVGARPFIQGITLWAVIAVLSLLAIRAGWITL